MNTNNAATIIALSEVISYSAEARVSKELLTASMAEVRMNCYEPGQITPMHKHPGEEEVLFDRNDNLPIKQGDLIRLPSDQFHSIRAAQDSRMVLVYFMKPGYMSQRPDWLHEKPATEELHGKR